MQPFHIQLWDLFLIQLTNWRWSWRGSLITGLIAPVMGMLAFAAFSDSHTKSLQYILTGNLVFSLLFGTCNKVASNFAYMRTTGMLDFFASMPMYRVALILASAAAFLLLALPTLGIILLLGVLFMDVSLHLSAWLIIVVPLVGFCLCGLGALIGTLHRPLEEVTSTASLVSFMMLFFGPVMLPAERLHPILRTLGYLSPSTYAASALRNVLFAGDESISLAVDIGVLILLMVGLLWWSAKRMDWRQV